MTAGNIPSKLMLKISAVKAFPRPKHENVGNSLVICGNFPVIRNQVHCKPRNWMPTLQTKEVKADADATKRGKIEVNSNIDATSRHQCPYLIANNADAYAATEEGGVDTPSQGSTLRGWCHQQRKKRPIPLYNIQRRRCQHHKPKKRTPTLQTKEVNAGVDATRRGSIDQCWALHNYHHGHLHQNKSGQQ